MSLHPEESAPLMRVGSLVGIRKPPGLVPKTIELFGFPQHKTPLFFYKTKSK